MQSLLNLFNLALTACGNAADVADPEGQTKSATLCRLHVFSARKAVFSALHWPELTAHGSLGLLKMRNQDAAWTAGDPAPGNLYTYALPADVVLPRYLHDYARFELGRGADGQVLHCNSSPALLCYTADVINPIYWSPQLFDAVTYELGARINMARSGKADLTHSLRQQAYQILTDAAVAVANSEDTYVESVPQGWAAAGFHVSTPVRYYYPTMTYRVEGING